MEKLKGVMSLIKYATLSTYMLVPTEEEKLMRDNYISTPYYPGQIPHYGKRGWCRVEYFIFGLWASMQGTQLRIGDQDKPWVHLYGIARNGDIRSFKDIEYTGDGDLPSDGALSNPNDAAAVKVLEETMIEAHAKAIVVIKCKGKAVKAYGHPVDLEKKLLRPSHVPALARAVHEHQITWLQLGNNQLSSAFGDGAARIVELIQANPQLTQLR